MNDDITTRNDVNINNYYYFITSLPPPSLSLPFPSTQNSILISSKAVYVYSLCCHSSRTAVELDGWRSNLKGC
jgi:hypothetical protein